MIPNWQITEPDMIASGDNRYSSCDQIPFLPHNVRVVKKIKSSFSKEILEISDLCFWSYFEVPVFSLWFNFIWFSAPLSPPQSHGNFLSLIVANDGGLDLHCPSYNLYQWGVLLAASRWIPKWFKPQGLTLFPQWPGWRQVVLAFVLVAGSLTLGFGPATVILLTFFLMVFDGCYGRKPHSTK